MDTLSFGTGLDKRRNDTYGMKADANKSNTFLTPDQSHRVITDAWRVIDEASLHATGETLTHPVLVLACAAIAVSANGISVHPDVLKEGNEKHQTIQLPESWWRALDVETNEIKKAIRSIKKMLETKN
jgi:hypothetical protein